MRSKAVIVFASGIDSVRRDITEALYENPAVGEVMVASEGHDALNKLLTNRCDLLLVDLLLPGLDGMAVLKKYKRLKPDSTAKVMLYTAINNPKVLSDCAVLGALYCFISPMSAEALVQRAIGILMSTGDTVAYIDNRPYRQSDIIMKIMEALHMLGVPPQLKGYTLLKSGLLKILVEPELNHALTKQLYPMLAEEYAISAVAVERAMRTAIESTWSNGNLDVINQVFGYSVPSYKGRPTNCEFLARMSGMVLSSVMASYPEEP